MSMDLYQLKTFFVFAKIRHFTETAKRLYITQSAVSHSLRKLEQSVGHKLYSRRGRSYILTDAGEKLFKVCQRIFFEIELFEEEMASGEFSKQKIYLGAPVEFGTNILSQQIRGFFEQYPHIHVNFLFSNDLSAPLMRDELDLIVDCRPHHHESIENIFLSKERYIVIATPQFIRERQVKTVKDLERVRILSLDDKGSWWNNFLLALPVEERPALNQILQFNHVRGLINAAINGIGISFVPRYTVVNELKQNILCDVFPECQMMDDHFCIYINKEKRKLQKNQLMIRFLTQCFSGFAD